MINKKRGFTLIEVLVAIAIIGILASLLLISLKSANQKAKQARAWQSFDQIALAMQLFYDKTGDWPNPTGTLFTMYQFSTTTTGNPQFVPDFYTTWDASWYCSDCKYYFYIYDFNNDRKPDIGKIGIGGPNKWIYRYGLCITNNTFNFCGKKSVYPPQ